MLEFRAVQSSQIRNIILILFYVAAGYLVPPQRASRAGV
jgi:hypothetical protein